MRKQRSSLSLATLMGSKTILFGAGTVLEVASGAAGYIAAFDLSSKRIALLPMAQSGGGAGMWMSGSGLVVDETKQAIFGVASNGTFNPETGDWAEAVFRASYAPPTAGSSGKLTIPDWWTPYLDPWRSKNSTASELPRLAGNSLSTAKEVDGQPVNAMHGHTMPAGTSMGDEDLGSAPCSYIPQYSELLCAGKDSIGYVVSSTNMGRTQASELSNPAGIKANYAKLLFTPFWYGTFPGNGVSANPLDAQDLNNNVWFDGKTNHIHMASVVDGNMLYVGAENSNMRAWRAKPRSHVYLSC